jgi:hypothetical protein
MEDNLLWRIAAHTDFLAKKKRELEVLERLVGLRFSSKPDSLGSNTVIYSALMEEIFVPNPWPGEEPLLDVRMFVNELNDAIAPIVARYQEGLLKKIRSEVLETLASKEGPKFER